MGIEMENCISMFWLEYSETAKMTLALIELLSLTNYLLLQE